MQTCSICNAGSVDLVTNCSDCGANLRENSLRAVALRRFRENPRVQYVRVIVASDCCPACHELEGAYALDEVPDLPVEACSHALGCRCNYQPFLTEIYP